MQTPTYAQSKSSGPCLNFHGIHNKQVQIVTKLMQVYPLEERNLHVAVHHNNCHCKNGFVVLTTMVTLVADKVRR